MPDWGGWDFEAYDYWKIDTFSFDAIWAIDPYMAQFSSSYHCSNEHLQEARNFNKNYVCTQSKIPVTSLQLFSFENRFYTDDNIEFIDLFFDNMHIKNLVPNKNLNDYLNYKKNRI